MEAQIKITGSSNVDVMKRKDAIEKVLKLSTEELSRLASLADSDKARSYLSSSIKFQTLKTFL